MGDFKKFEDLFFIPIRPLNSVDDPNELAKGEAGFHYPSRTWVLRDPNTGEFVRPNKFDGALSMISERIDENNRLFAHGAGEILFYDKLTDIKSDLNKTTATLSDLMTHMRNKSVYVEEFTSGSADYANLAPLIKSGLKGYLKISKINGTIFASAVDETGAEYKRIITGTDPGVWAESGASTDIQRYAFGGVYGFAAEPTSEAAAKGNLEMSVGSSNNFPAPLPLTTKSIPITYSTRESYTPGGMMSFTTQGAIDYPNFLRGADVMEGALWKVVGAEKVDCPDPDKILFKATANTVQIQGLVDNKVIAAIINNTANFFADINVFVDRADSQITEVKSYIGQNRVLTAGLTREPDALFMQTDYPLKHDSPVKFFDHFRFRGSVNRGTNTIIGADKVLLTLEVKFNTVVDKKNPFLAFDKLRACSITYNRSADILTSDWNHAIGYLPATGFSTRKLNYTLTGKRLDNPNTWLEVPLSPATLSDPRMARSLLADAPWSGTGAAKNSLITTVFSNNGIVLKAPGRAVVYYYEKTVLKSVNKPYKTDLDLFVPNSSWFIIIVEKTVPPSVITSTFDGNADAGLVRPCVSRWSSKITEKDNYHESKLYHKQGIGTWGSINYRGHVPTDIKFSGADACLHGWQTTKLPTANMSLHNGTGFQYVETAVIPDTMVEAVSYINEKAANVGAGGAYKFWSRWGVVSIGFPTGTFATVEEARTLMADFEVAYRKPHRLDKFEVKGIDINNVIPPDATFIPAPDAIKFTSIIVPASEGAKQTDVYNKLMDISLAMTDLSNIVNKGDSSSSGITGAVNVGPTGKRSIVVPNFPHEPGRDMIILYENDKPLIEGLDFVSRKLPDGKIELTRTQGNWTPNATIRVISLKSLITEQDSAKMVPMIFKSQYSVTAAARNTIPIAIDVYNPESTGETLMVTENNYVIYRGLNFDVKHGTIQRENGTNYVGWYIELKDYQAQKGHEYNFNLIKAVASNDVKDVTSIAALEGRISNLEQGGIGGGGSLPTEVVHDIQAMKNKIEQLEALISSGSGGGSSGGGDLEIIELEILASTHISSEWKKKDYSTPTKNQDKTTFDNIRYKTIPLNSDHAALFGGKYVHHVEVALGHPYVSTLSAFESTIENSGNNPTLSAFSPQFGAIWYDNSKTLMVVTNVDYLVDVSATSNIVVRFWISSKPIKKKYYSLHGIR